MKKLFSIFALAGMVAMTGCSSDDDVELVDDPAVIAPAEPVTPPPPMPAPGDTMMGAPGMTGMTGMTGPT
jgi:hypothetical protein